MRLLAGMLTLPSLFPTYCNTVTSYGHFFKKKYFVFSPIIIQKQYERKIPYTLLQIKCDNLELYRTQSAKNILPSCGFPKLRTAWKW